MNTILALEVVFIILGIVGLILLAFILIVDTKLKKEQEKIAKRLEKIMKDMDNDERIY